MITSKKEGHPGFRSSLQRADFGVSGTPDVTGETIENCGTHGTIVEAELHNIVTHEPLQEYLRAFVRYVPEPVIFNGKTISKGQFINQDRLNALQKLMSEPLTLNLSPNSSIRAKFHKDDAGTIVVLIEQLYINDVQVSCSGLLWLKSGTLEVFKKGFKLCNTSIPSNIGISGRLDTINVSPTAGRDSLSAESQQFINTLVSAIEKQAIEIILNSSDLLAQHTRIIRQVISLGMIERLGKLDVNLADGAKITLEKLRGLHNVGIKIYFGSRVVRELLDILQASGNVIVILSSESNRRKAETNYLSSYCHATSYEGLVEVKEKYLNLSSFEIDFLSNLEMTIKLRYEVTGFTLIPAAISGGVPAFVKGRKGSKVTVYIDVRHQEIKRLNTLEGSSFLYSMANEFCKEYLASSLKTKSHKFFGNGSIDFDELIKKRAELWKLAEGDIFTFVPEVGDASAINDVADISRNTQGIRDVFKNTDIKTVEVGQEKYDQTQEEDVVSEGEPAPKILLLIDRSKGLDIGGFYFKLMDGPAKAFRDDIQAMEESSVFWFGNRITYAFTDAKNIAFHYELRLQQIIIPSLDINGKEIPSVIQLMNPIQEYQGSMYFRIPQVIDSYLIPTGGVEILVRVNYDWFDLRRGRTWPF